MLLSKGADSGQRPFLFCDLIGELVGVASEHASVKWPVRRDKPSLLVPKTSVVTTTERTFVIRSRAGRAEWITVAKGAADGDALEVFGDLRAGDLVVRMATDEIREGVSVAK